MLLEEVAALDPLFGARRWRRLPGRRGRAAPTRRTLRLRRPRCRRRCRTSAFRLARGGGWVVGRRRLVTVSAVAAVIVERIVGRLRTAHRGRGQRRGPVGEPAGQSDHDRRTYQRGKIVALAHCAWQGSSFIFLLLLRVFSSLLLLFSFSSPSLRPTRNEDLCSAGKMLHDVLVEWRATK